jgi:S-adenosyl-L-methionine hydrolase (adenosine-forming)
MSLVTLTTDLGYRDPYLAIVKAKLLTENPGVQIIDLSCDIKDNTISDAAFVLKNALPFFPKETIHLVGVKLITTNSGWRKTQNADNTRYLLSKYADQYILTPDNGLFSLLNQEYSEPVFQLYYDNNTRHHFFLKDIFTGITQQLLNGKKMEEIALPTTDFFRSTGFESFVDRSNGRNLLRGRDLYVDDFGNIITNITYEQFEKVIGNKKFSITLPGHRITEISNSYDDAADSKALVFFNSFGYLEVALNGGSAYKLLCKREIGMKKEFNLVIEFYD